MMATIASVVSTEWSAMLGQCSRGHVSFRMAGAADTQIRNAASPITLRLATVMPAP